MKKILTATPTQLVSGKPYWPVHNGDGPRYPKLEEDATCDAAVIGGGITGALASYELTKEGFDTILLEKNRIASGSTSASTALLSYEYDLLLSHLTDRIGEKAAVRCYELCHEAVTRIHRILNEIGDSCGWDDKVSIRVARSPGVEKTFEKEARARERRGLRVDVLNEEELQRRFGMTALAGIVSKNAAQIDPFSLTRRLVNHSNKKGMRVFENTKVTKFETSKNEANLKTSKGYRITAKKVVFATGYESEKYLPKKVAILNTDYCFISHPVRKMKKIEKCHMVEHGSNYLYMSTFGNRIMVGVEAGTFHSPGQRKRMLRSRTKDLLESVHPYLFEFSLTADYAWAGTFARSRDSLPYLGEVKGMPHALFILGYGGNGIAGSAMLARLLPDLIRSKPSKDTKLFEFDR